MTPYLYGGQFRRISDLAATVIWDINPWLPHQVRFGWGYVAMNATLWIDRWDHFAMEHQDKWTKQKEQEYALNDLERDMEVVYRARIIRRQEDKLIADSKEAAPKDLPPERRAARAERQAATMPRKDNVSSMSMSITLYSDWVLSRAGKRSSPDTPQPYQMPREGTGRRLTLEDEEENLKLRQINVTHVSIMDLLGDPGNPLYAEPHSMAEHYDAMLVGARALCDLPERTRCRDSSAMARVHEDEAQQVCQKILRCLDMRVMDGDLIVPTCLRTPTLILSARHCVQLYYDPDAQGQYVSDFPTRGQGFLQPRGDIRMSIVPRNFRILPDDVREVIDLYFHREGLDVQENQESYDCTSIDTEAANTVRRLQLHCQVATASLQMAMHEAIAPATATRPQEEE